MTHVKTIVTIVLAVIAAGATIWMASEMTGGLMPFWMAALGPILMLATLWAHLRSRRG